MEEMLARLLEDYVARRQRGDRASAEDYRVSAGAEWERFQRLIEAESSFDEALKEEEGDLPREFGAYTLLRELGRGATGIVYEARRGDRTVALKVLRHGFDAGPDAITRFRREAEACGRIRHDHVVRVYEAGEAEGRPYYAMAFLDGRSLSALARSGALPEPRELARRIAKVADALHEIHGKGVIHRDVKPGNIMADSQGRMVLADFGLARSAGAATLTRTGEALGTPLFMSPEQLLGDRARVDGRADVYGLGATLYELLSRRPLFEATDWPELVRAILDERPRPLHEVAPAVPVELSRVVMKALEKRPEDRYADAAAMRDDLLAFAEGRSVEGRPVSDARLRLRRVRGRWKPLAIAALVLVVATYLFLTWNATLRITTYPAAEALLDDESLGLTPLVAQVRPGKHRLVLRSPGFEDYVWEEKLVWGSTATIDNTLKARPDDPRALAMLAERYGLVTVKLEAVERTRGVDDDDWIEPISPRGNVRREDVDALQIDIGEAWEDEGTIEVRRGEEVVYSEDFAPVALSTIRLVPELAAALRPGDEFEWGFHPVKGEPKVVRCKLVPTPPGIERLEQDLAGQDPAVRGHLRALAFLKEGLDYAAWDEAWGVIQFDRPDRGLLAVMQQALKGMKLEGTPFSRGFEELVRLADEAGK